MSSSQIIYFAKFEILPLASSDGIYNMFYTVITTLVGRLVLKEYISRRKGTSLFLCVVGCLFICIGLVFTVHQVENANKALGDQFLNNMTNRSLDSITQEMVTNEEIFQVNHDPFFHIDILVQKQ